MSVDKAIHEMAMTQFEQMVFINPKQKEMLAGIVEQLQYSYLIEVLNEFAIYKMRLEAMMRPENKMQDEQVEDFFQYLTEGQSESGVRTSNTMTPKQAFSAIYWLQESSYPAIEDKWELCQVCDGLVNTHIEGTTVEEDDTDEEIKAGTPAGTYHDECFLPFWNSPY